MELFKKALLVAVLGLSVVSVSAMKRAAADTQPRIVQLSSGRWVIEDARARNGFYYYNNVTRTVTRQVVGVDAANEAQNLLDAQQNVAQAPALAGNNNVANNNVADEASEDLADAPAPVVAPVIVPAPAPANVEPTVFPSGQPPADYTPEVDAWRNEENSSVYVQPNIVPAPAQQGYFTAGNIATATAVTLFGARTVLATSPVGLVLTVASLAANPTVRRAVVNTGSRVATAINNVVQSYTQEESNNNQNNNNNN